MENELDTQESLNLEENQNSENTENAEVEDVEALKEKLTKAEELAKNQKIRAEKAEAEAKKLKVVQPQENETPKNEDRKYSLKDIDDIATLSAIHKDDRAEVVDYADRNKITIAEALSRPFVKSFLGTQEEFRKSAQATSTGSGKRGSSKASAEDLLEKAKGGDLPDDSDSIAAIIAAKRASEARK